MSILFYIRELMYDTYLAVPINVFFSKMVLQEDDLHLACIINTNTSPTRKCTRICVTYMCFNRIQSDSIHVCWFV